MINFRYHVVSLTAVFLALAIGLVVGTAALNGPLSDALKNQVGSLTKQTQTYRDRITQLETETGKQEQFTQQAAPLMLNGKLAARRVLVVSTSQTAGSVAKVVDYLKMAGATVTGQVEVQDRFFDPASNSNLLDVSNGAVPPGLTGIPLNSNGVETASYLLAAGLVQHNPPLTTDAVRTVVTAFKEGNFIVPTGDLTVPAEAVAVVVGEPYADSAGDAKNNNVLTMAEWFSKAGPTVVATSGAGGTGNVIGAVRGDPKLSKTIATVDNVTTPDGQVCVPLALAEFLGTTKPGHYGVAGGSTAMLPKPPKTTPS
ncbi:MAG: hypothetical protein AUG44_28145 [Actinobacteria bacterium 13_1_20CM_3_71_11]|nr:MAG: hypothetical protein AUG44_28145 [Actinobacteria bacterium 13_1_20CM_3_71_11]